MKKMIALFLLVSRSMALAGVEWRESVVEGDELKGIAATKVCSVKNDTGSVSFSHNKPDLILCAGKYSFFDSKSDFEGDTLRRYAYAKVGVYDKETDGLVRTFNVYIRISDDKPELGFVWQKDNQDVVDIHEALADGRYKVRIVANRYGTSDFDVMIPPNETFRGFEYLHSYKKIKMEKDEQLRKSISNAEKWLKSWESNSHMSKVGGVTFSLLRKNMCENTEEFFSKLDPKKSATVRVMAKNRYDIWVRYDTTYGSEKMGLVLADNINQAVVMKTDSFKGRNIESCLLASTNLDCYAMIRYDKKLSAFAVDKFMSVRDFAKCSVKQELSELKKYCKTLSDVECGKFMLIMSQYADIRERSYEFPAIEQHVASLLSPSKLKQLFPGKYDQMIAALADVKRLLDEEILEMRRHSAYRWSAAYRDTAPRSPMSTSEFLRKWDRIESKGWSDEKKRKAFGNLIDSRF